MRDAATGHAPVGTLQVLRDYGIRANPRVDTERGTRLALRGIRASDGSRYLSLAFAFVHDVPRETIVHPCPLERADAAAMVDHLRARRVIVPGDPPAGALIDLLVNLSRLFVERDLAGVSLDPVIVHENTYDVAAASFTERYDARDLPRPSKPA